MTQTVRARSFQDLPDERAHAVRQSRLYGGIWAQDPGYGTRMEDVLDTVAHRIAPHVHRAYGRAVSVIDFGAGDGRFLRMLRDIGVCHEGTGVDVYMPRQSDFAWLQQPLWVSTGIVRDYAISTDTLEHLPSEMIPQTLRNIARSASHGFLRISNRQDVYGTERGLHLHETVEPPQWWLDRCREAGIEPTSWRIYPNHATEVWW